MEGSNKKKRGQAAKVQSGLLATSFLHLYLCGPSLLLIHILIGTLFPF